MSSSQKKPKKPVSSKKPDTKKTKNKRKWIKRLKYFFVTILIIGFAFFVFEYLKGFPFFYMNSENTTEISYPLPEQTVGNSFNIILSKESSLISLQNIDLFVNGEKIPDEDVNDKIKEFHGQTTVFTKIIPFSKINPDGVKVGDTIEFSFSRYNKEQAKVYGSKGNFVEGQAKWKYEEKSIPAIKHVSKKMNKNILKPDYIAHFSLPKNADMKDLEDSLSVYIGEGGRKEQLKKQEDENPVRSNLFDCNKLKKLKKWEVSFKSESGDTTKIILEDDLARKKDGTCVYLIFNHVDASKSSSYKLIDSLIYIEPNAEIRVETVFDPENDFYSTVAITFDTPLFVDYAEIKSEEFIKHRQKQKERLLEHFEVIPEVEINTDKIVLHASRAIIPLRLDEFNAYEFKLKGLKDAYGETPPDSELSFVVKDHEFAGLKLQDKKSVYIDIKLPRFSYIQYDHPKTSIKLCRVGIEQYGLIEYIVAEKNEIYEISDEFFHKGIDSIETMECKTKLLQTEKDEYIHEFTIDDLIGNPGRSGLYYLTFETAGERKLDDTRMAVTPLFFSIVDSHITFKVSKNNKAMFWVNDFEGNGVPGVTIRAYKSDITTFEEKWNEKEKESERIYLNPLTMKEGVFEKPLVLGKTNNKGFLEVEFPQELDAYNSAYHYSYDGHTQRSVVFTASSDDHLTYVSNRWNNGIARWNFGYSPINYYGYFNEGNWHTGEQFSAHMYTDRKLYLSGETVHLKTIIREHGKTLTTPSKDQKFILKLQDPEFETLFEEEFIVNDFGSFLKDYVLPKNTKLGQYHLILLTVNKDFNEQFAYSSFTVEEFKKPGYKVEIHLSSRDIEDTYIKDPEIESKETDYGYSYKTFKKTLKIISKVHTSYYASGAVSNAKYTYHVYRQEYFNDSYWEDCYYGCYYEPNKTFYSSGSGELDENGSANFEISVDHTSRWDNYRYIVEVTVIDQNGESITGNNSIIAQIPEKLRSANPNIDLKLDLEKYIVKNGENLKIKIFPSRKWDKAYNDRSVLKIIRRIYTSKHSENTQGRIVSQIDFEDIAIEEKNVSDEEFFLEPEGGLSYTFTPSSPGEYIIQTGDLPTEEEKKFYAIQTKKFYVYDPETVNNTPIIDDNKIRVVHEKNSYKLGETAQILIHLPYNNAKALLTIEKSHVVEKRVIDIPSNVYFLELPVDDTFVPNAYISVVAFHPGDEPNYKVGYTEIVVDKSEKKLRIKSKTDKEEYKPREKVTITLQTNNNNGELIASELSVAVVDESLIALLGNIDMDILKKFYKKIAFQTDTSLTDVAMQDQIYFSRKGYVGGSGDKGSGQAVFTRSLFKNTAYYNGNVRTDKNGKAVVSFTLPDNIGDFRIIVLGSTKSAHFGAHENTFSVRKDIIVEDTFPMIFRQGDTLKVGATVFNHSDKDRLLLVKLDTQDLRIKQENFHNITVKANNRNFVTWEVEIFKKPLEEVKYIISVSDASDSDQIEKKVKLATTPLIGSYIADLKDFKTSSSDIALNYTGEINKELSYIEFTVSVSLFSGIEKIVTSLMSYPHGCVEQITSTTIPNAILKKFTETLSLNIDHEKLQKNLDDGIQKILNMQTDDGGFGYWPGDKESSGHYSPYAIWGLATMKNLGIPVPEDQLNKGEAYLVARIKNLSQTDDRYRISELVEELHALSALKSIYFETAYTIVKQYESKFGNHEKIVFGLSMATYNKDMYRNHIQSIISSIDFNKQEKKYYYYYYNDKTDKALFAQLLILADPNNSQLVPFVKELYSYNFSSYYYSTQTKNQAFLTFVSYMENIEKNQRKNPVLRYTVANKRGTIILNNRKLFKTTRFYFSGLEDLVDNTVNFHFEKQKENDDMVYASALLVIFPKNPKDIKAASNGVKVSRQIFSLKEDGEIDMEKNLLNENLKISEPYLVKVTFTFDKDARDIAMEDYLPSGLKVLHEKFQTVSSRVKQHYDWVDHKEYRADMVFAASRYVSGGNHHEIHYYVTPVLEGTYVYPPVSVYEMYNPSVEGHTGYEVLKVEK